MGKRAKGSEGAPDSLAKKKQSQQEQQQRQEEVLQHDSFAVESEEPREPSQIKAQKGVQEGTRVGGQAEAQVESQADLEEKPQEGSFEGSQDSQDSQESLQKEASPEEQIAALEQEKMELQESLLRKQADFENYRRRIQKEKEDAVLFANRLLMGDLLEVLDNFERALASHDKEASPEVKVLFEGLEMVEKQLFQLLAKNGLKAMESVGQEFDPNFHEALMMEESTEYKRPTVVENFQTGYFLREKLLRPARVKVAGPKA